MRCFVSGHVQGVFYRVSTQDEANALGLTGWARNLPDGRVEVMASGERDKLLELFAWLKKGPDGARVEDVTYEELPWKEFGRFSVM